MRQVNLYVEQTNKAINPQDGVYGYVLEFLREEKDSIKKEDYKMIKDSTAHQTELIAIAEALSRLTEQCHVTIFSAHGFYKAALIRKWIIKWQQSGWKNAKGEPVANQKEWEKLIVELARHSVITGSIGEHPYSKHMLEKMRKMEG